MGTPQIIMLVLISVQLLLTANLHGKTKTGKHNFWSTLISNSITLTILYLGGFFS